jgi:hypothetical protein
MRLTDEPKDPESASSSARSPALTILPSLEVAIRFPNTPMRSPNRTPSAHDRLRLPPPPAMPTCVPPLPPAWEGTEQMRDWLRAKTEEDKRRQQEEKTHQATLALEQRRVEHAMMSESLRAGVPPHLVPMMFNGLNTTDSKPLSAASQRLWSGPGTTIPQQTMSGYASTQQAPRPPHQAPELHPQPPQQPNIPAKMSYSKSKSRPKKKICLPGMDQPSSPIDEAPVDGPVTHSDSLEVAFQDTMPFAASLEQAAWSHAQSKPLEGPNLVRGTQYQYWTPKGQWSSQPQHPIRQQQLQIPANHSIPIMVPHHGQERKSSDTKRKDTRSHGKVPPPLSHLSDQGPAEGSRTQANSTHKRYKSDISGSYDSRAYEGDSSEPPQTPTVRVSQQPSGTAPIVSSAQPSAQLSTQTNRPMPESAAESKPWINAKYQCVSNEDFVKRLNE